MTVKLNFLGRLRVMNGCLYVVVQYWLFNEEEGSRKTGDIIYIII